MRHALLVVILAPLLLLSCKSADSFSKRKYLPGTFTEHRPESHNEIKRERIASLTADNSVLQEEEQPVPAIPVQQEQASDESEVSSSNYPEADMSACTVIEENKVVAQPQDTIPKSKRQIRKERRRTDQFRSRASYTLGIQSIITAVLYTLLGLWLGSQSVYKFTDDLFLLIVLILFIIPIYFALALTSLVDSIFSIFLGQKVRNKHKGETAYEGEKQSRVGILLSIIGLVLLTLGTILTIPHAFDW